MTWSDARKLGIGNRKDRKTGKFRDFALSGIVGNKSITTGLQSSGDVPQIQAATANLCGMFSRELLCTDESCSKIILNSFKTTRVNIVMECTDGRILLHPGYFSSKPL